MNEDFRKRVYRKNEAMVSRKIGDEVILVPISRDVGDLESIYTLNDVAARIWELVDGIKNVGEIEHLIVDEYDVTQTEAEGDIEGYLGQLEEIRAVGTA